jgi:type I restriction enzyme S subunit
VPKGRNALLAQDEIIVVRSGAYTADSAIIPQEYEGTVAGYDMVVTVTGAVPHFVALALLSNYLKVDQLITASMRAAQPHLNAEELGNSIVLLPPIGVQTAIIEATSTLTVTFDTAISRAEREIELLREYRTTLTAAVVTGKLDVRDAARGLPTSADALPSEDGPDDADEPDEAD